MCYTRIFVLLFFFFLLFMKYFLYSPTGVSGPSFRRTIISVCQSVTNCGGLLAAENCAKITTVNQYICQPFQLMTIFRPRSMTLFAALQLGMLFTIKPCRFSYLKIHVNYEIDSVLRKRYFCIFHGLPAHHGSHLHMTAFRRKRKFLLNWFFTVCFFYRFQTAYGVVHYVEEKWHVHYCHRLSTYYIVIIYINSYIHDARIGAGVIRPSKFVNK